MTLYLKYRPQTIDELDLVEVRKTLKKILKSGQIPHAFLFAGPKGTGKTSAARILAKYINCEAKKDMPCNKCNQCISITKGSNLDVIELDAASNRGIDDVRLLKEGIMLAPAGALKKVYIIDEAHMLTTEASNAFLKTLEEPPDHVIFILATTNPEKLPDTVRSRLTHVPFHKASIDEIKDKLIRIARKEKAKSEAKALEKIAEIADGSFRDAVKTLEQIIVNYSDVYKKNVEKFLSNNKPFSVANFVNLLLTKDNLKIIKEIEDLVNRGVSISNLVDQSLRVLHQKLLTNDGDQNDLIKLVDLLHEAKRQMAVTPIQQLPLEIAVVKWIGNQVEPPKEKKIKSAPPARNATQSVAGGEIKLEITDNNIWPRILETARAKNTTIEALLRAAKLMGFDGKSMVIGIYYQFHKERLEVMQNRKALEDIVTSCLGGKLIKISYQLTEKPARNASHSDAGGEMLTPKVDQDIIEAAKEIFGN